MSVYEELGDLSVDDYAATWLRPPRSATELLAELRRLRGLTVYPFVTLRLRLTERWIAQACAEGAQPDRLRRYSRDETERFWAHTVPGPEGHVYWTGPQRFKRNDGTSAAPYRWVWIREHGPLALTDEITTTCGEARCVALEHLRRRPRWETRHGFSTQAMIGRLQVAAMRLGRPPMRDDWDRNHERPSTFAYAKRFGSWSKALAAAGLVSVED